MKKKIALMVTSLVLVVAMAVGGTLAYLSSTSNEVENTFTVGKVKIKLDEAEIVNGVPTGDRTEEGNEYHIIPGSIIDKDPTVRVLEGSEESWVRMQVTIYDLADLDEIFAAQQGANLQAIFTGGDARWEYQAAKEVRDTENDCITYEFWYNQKVTSASEIPALFQHVVIPAFITDEQLAELDEFKINVIAHAIQAENLTTMADAWAAFEAQTSNT